MKRQTTGLWNNLKKTRHGPVITILFIFACLFLAAGFIFPGLGLGRIGSPLTRAGTWIHQKTFPWIDFDANSAKRVRELQSRAALLAADKAELEELRRQNDQLRAALNFVERRYAKVVGADVTGRSASKRATAFTINAGSTDGLSLNDPVVVGEGNLVGKVSSLSAHNATVTAVTNLDHATAVSLLNSNRTIGIAKGALGDLLNLEFIPHEEKIGIGDLAVTSGLEEKVPSRLVVGIVTAVFSDPNEPFQSAIIEPLVKMADYSQVSVLIIRDSEL